MDYTLLTNTIEAETQERRTKRAKHDLHYFTYAVAMPDSKDLMTHFDTIDGMPRYVLDALLDQKGIDWFHWYMMDMYRYQVKSSTETANTIPLYTPLGAEMRKWEHHKEKDFCVRLWIPNRHKWQEPIIEYGQQTDNSEMPLCELTGCPPEGLYLRWYPGMRNTTTITARQMLKSTINRAKNAFTLARNPLTRILLVCASDNNAVAHTTTLKQILDSPAWNTYFPHYKAGSPWSVNLGLKFDLPNRRVAKENNLTPIGLKTGVTGGHVDIEEFDDLEDERSHQGGQMEEVKKKFFEMSGQIGDAGSYWSVIGTIWVGDDSGLMYPLLKQNVDGRNIRSNLILCDSIDGEGQSVYLKHPTSYIQKQEATLPPDQYAQQWRCMVNLATDRLFDVNNIAFVKEDEFAKWKDYKFDRIVVCTDFAYTSSKSSDWTCMMAMGAKWNETLLQDDLYVLFLASTKVTNENTYKFYAKAIKHLYTTYGLKSKMIDYAEIGTLDEDMFRKEALKYTVNGQPLRMSLQRFDRRTNKTTKADDILRAAQAIERYKVYCPQYFFYETNRGGKKGKYDVATKKEQIERLRSQAANFTVGTIATRKNDVLDAFSMCIDRIDIRSQGVKREEEKKQRPQLTDREQSATTFFKTMEKPIIGERPAWMNFGMPSKPKQDRFKRDGDK